MRRPLATVTFLFTDVEGSTKLLVHMPEAYSVALKRHDRIIRAAVKANGGTVFETIGEAIYASFDGAADALAAALDAQLALSRADWTAAVPLRVRMALHRGEVERRARHYFGTALYRCSRLIALAHGEQVLASKAVADAVGSALPDGALLRPLGSYRLRDFDDEEPVLQLTHPALRSEFPPLRSGRPRQGDLPSEVSSFIGREREVASIVSALSRSRIVTLAGPGGCGKTRLARQVGREIGVRFEDGLRYVDLSQTVDHSLVAPAIAHAVGASDRPDRPIEDALVDHLADKEILLVVDGFDRVVEAAALLVHLISTGPRVAALITSRNELRVSGERVFVVPPLELPSESASPGDLTRSEAVRLFMDRASSHDASRSFTPTELGTIATICRRLDGLPLAIELAAARIDAFGVAGVAARMASPLQLLTGGPRDAPVRHRTLLDTFRWSYDLLEPAGRTVLGRASVFAGAFTPDLAQEVCDPSRALSSDVSETLETLIRASFIQRSDHAGEPRYRLLQTVRDFAFARVGGEAEILEERRADALIRLVRPRQGEPEASYLDRIELAHDDLRAALRWSVQRQRAATALALASGALHLWQTRGYWTEGRSWFASILEMDAPHGLSRERGAAAYRAGILAHWQGDGLAAEQMYEEAAAVARGLGDDVELFKATINLGVLAAERGELQRAADLYAACTAIHAKDPQAIAALNPGGFLVNQAELDAAMGALDRATERYEQALDIFRARSSMSGMAEVMTGLGEIALLRGDTVGAGRCLEEALRLNEDLGRRAGMVRVLSDLAISASAGHRTEDAVVLAGKAMAALPDPLNLRLLGDALCASAVVARSRGHSQLARTLAAGLRRIETAVTLRVAPVRTAQLSELLGPAVRTSHSNVAMRTEDLVDLARAAIDPTSSVPTWLIATRLRDDGVNAAATVV